LLSLFIFFERGEHATIAWKYSALQAEHHHHHHIFAVFFFSYLFIFLILFSWGYTPSPT
jgi:hypothetical protein